MGGWRSPGTLTGGRMCWIWWRGEGEAGRRALGRAPRPGRDTKTEPKSGILGRREFTTETRSHGDAMGLTGAERKQLVAALVSACPDLPALRRLISFHLETTLDRVAAGARSLDEA